MEEPSASETRPYVSPATRVFSPSAVPAPLSIVKKEQENEADKKEKKVVISTPDHLESLKKQEEAHTPANASGQVPSSPEKGSPHPPSSKPSIQRSATVKLQKKRKSASAAAQAEILQSLPTIPEGPSSRRSSLLSKKASGPAPPPHVS